MKQKKYLLKLRNIILYSVFLGAIAGGFYFSSDKAEAAAEDCYKPSAIVDLAAKRNLENGSPGALVLSGKYKRPVACAEEMIIDFAQFQIRQNSDIGDGSVAIESATPVALVDKQDYLFTVTISDTNKIKKYIHGAGIVKFNLYVEFETGVFDTGVTSATFQEAYENAGAGGGTTTTTVAGATTTNSGGSTTTSGSGSGTISFANPLKFSTVEEILTSLLGNLQGIIVTLSIIFIVIGGIFYITSAGNEKRTTAAKNALTASLIGLAIGIAAPSFLKEISTILGWNSTSSEISEAVSLTQILLNILNFLLSVAGVIALIMLVVGGVTYVTSAGEEERIKTAKKIFLYSIVGIALTLAAMVIVRQIAKFFI